MTETIRFDGISLPVSDVECSVAFYQQFGFEVQIQHANFALLRLGEGTIGLFKMDLSKWPNAPRGAIHIELSTENLDALFEQLEAQGVHFASPPVIAPGSDKCLLMTPMGIVWKSLRDGEDSLRHMARSRATTPNVIFCSLAVAGANHPTGREHTSFPKQGAN